MEANPYAPPLVTKLAAPVDQVEAVRSEHLRAERTAKSAGLLYYLVGFLFLLIGAGNLLDASANNVGRRQSDALVVASLTLVLGAILVFVAFGLRRLHPWSRWFAVLFSAIGLLLFPIGTILNTIILVNLLGAKGNLVFSPEYKNIIAATPHVKMKTSLAVKVLLVILLLILAASVAFTTLMSS